MSGQAMNACQELPHRGEGSRRRGGADWFALDPVGYEDGRWPTNEVDDLAHREPHSGEAVHRGGLSTELMRSGRRFGDDLTVCGVRSADHPPWPVSKDRKGRRLDREMGGDGPKQELIRTLIGPGPCQDRPPDVVTERFCPNRPDETVLVATRVPRSNRSSAACNCATEIAPSLLE